jgi:thiol-disulfide isomerase/thioredoxin
MSPFLILAITIIGIFVLIQIWMFIKSKKLVGMMIPFDKIDSKIIDSLKDKKGLIYFFSPSCHNCKLQTPIIEKLNSKYESIISIDTSKNLETARAFNVMGTPSIVMFSGNKIIGYYVGVKKESFILEKVNSL